MNRLKRKECDRPRAFWGALISAGLGVAGALLNSSAQKKQRRLQANLEDYNNSLEEAQGMTNALNAGQDYQQNYLQQFKQQARLGTTRRLGSRNIMITDGGNAKRIGNNTYLLRGGSHEDINETGQTGIGINVGGNEIEAEGGEVAQRKGNSLRIYSAQPILGGISPAQAIMRGYNKDKVFNAQQRFKKNNGIKDDGSQQRNGGEVPYNHYDPTGLFGGSPHPLAKIVDITGITSYGDVKKLIDKKRRGEIPTTQEYLGALSAIPAIGRIAKGLNLIGNIADATTFMKDVKESEAKENAYQNEIVKYRDIHGRIKTGRRGDMPYSAHELRKRLGGRCKLRNDGLTSKDKGSSKHPYPSVSSKDFAGGNRSYPIPTKADAVDALRLAGLHGRSDVRSKVYSKYPSLRPKAAFGDWIRTNRDDNVLANLLYESGIIDKNAWRNMLRDIHTFTGMGSDPYNDNQDEAVVTPGFGISNRAQMLRNVQQANKVAQSARASQAAQRTSYAVKQAKDFYRDLGINIPVGRSQTYNPAFRSSLLARNIEDSNKALQMSLNNTHLPKGIRLTPIDQSSIGRTAARVINPREAEIVRIGIPIGQSAKNMTNGVNPFLYVPRSSNETLKGLSRVISSAKQGAKSAGQKVGNKLTSSSTYRNPTFAERVRDANGKLIWKQNYKYKPWVKATAGAAGTAGVIGLGVGLSNTKSEDENIKVQLDAKGKPISPYIARPQEQAKPQAKKSVPIRKDTIATKPATRQVPATIARKDTTRTDTTRTNTTKQVNKVVKRQVRTTPQYTGNTTKGNYQLHDGETKVINGIKYTRRGNTIINHKTNVGYIYDKNGNYTAQADYSKVGNFNQAFDAARAAGRNQFIYRAGKYNNYSTVKETNAKKEALNRRIGARRIAKRMGGLTNPPVGRFKCGGRIRPKAEDGMLAPIYSYGTDKRRFPSFAPIDVTPRAIPNFKPVSVPTNTKTPFDPNSVPYLGKQSSFKPTTQDYIGLGIDTLASLGIGLINSSAASKTYLPERPAIIQASKLPTYYNVAPQVEELKRQRDILNEEIANNTSSSVAALNRISRIRGAATGEINKLYATKENEENKMLTQDALNQQQVAAENAKLQADYETNKANILNAASQAKANALSGTLSGLSQAWNNFASSVENRYDAKQNEIAAISSANNPSVVKNAISLEYNLSPEVLANLYKNSKNEELRNTILGRLSPNERKRYGIK